MNSRFGYRAAAIGAVLAFAAIGSLWSGASWADDEMGEKEKCVASIADESTPTLAKRHEAVAPNFVAQVQATGGGFVGGGYGGSFGYDGPAKDPSTLGYGWNAAVRGDVDLLHPLWLGGTLALYSGPNRAAVQLDAIAGLSSRTYGPRWVPAGRVNNNGIVTAWDGHCQLRRAESTLFAGLKTQIAFGAAKGEPDPHNWMALQLGYLSTFKVNNLSAWSIAALVDPYHKAFGAQYHLGGTGFYGLPKWFYVGTQGGAMLAGEIKGGWFTFDLGVKLEK